MLQISCGDCHTLAIVEDGLSDSSLETDDFSDSDSPSDTDDEPAAAGTVYAWGCCNRGRTGLFTHKKLPFHKRSLTAGFLGGGEGGSDGDGAGVGGGFGFGGTGSAGSGEEGGEGEGRGGGEADEGAEAPGSDEGVNPQEVEEETSAEGRGMGSEGDDVAASARTAITDSGRREEDEVRRYLAHRASNTDEGDKLRTDLEHYLESYEPQAIDQFAAAPIVQPRPCDPRKRKAARWQWTPTATTTHSDGESDGGSSFESSDSEESALETRPKTMRAEQIACGGAHSLVLRRRRVFSFGDNSKGQLGRRPRQQGASYCPFWTAVDVGGKVKVKQIACGDLHCLVLTKDGKIFSWGSSADSRLGYPKQGGVQRRPRQVSIPLPDERRHRIVHVACGAAHSAAVSCSTGSSHRGTLWTWGRNDCGQCGPFAIPSKQELVKMQQNPNFNIKTDAPEWSGPELEVPWPTKVEIAAEADGAKRHHSHHRHHGKPSAKAGTKAGASAGGLSRLSVAPVAPSIVMSVRSGTRSRTRAATVGAAVPLPRCLIARS